MPTPDMEDQKIKLNVKRKKINKLSPERIMHAIQRGIKKTTPYGIFPFHPMNVL